MVTVKESKQQYEKLTHKCMQFIKGAIQQEDFD